MHGKTASAFAVTALFALTALLPAVGAYVGPPPPEPSPGWGPVGAIDVDFEDYLVGFAERSDGSYGILATYEIDGVTGKKNATLSSKLPSYWYPRWLVGGLDEIALLTVAVTDHADRAGLYAYAFVQGATWGAAVSFVDDGGNPAAPVQFSDTPTLVGMDIAATPTGNVMGVWANYTTTGQIWANHSGPLSGWDGSVAVANYTGPYALDIAAIGGDDFVLVWSERGSSGDTVMAARYRGGVGWGSPQAIAPPVASLQWLSVATSPAAGRGAVVIQSTDATATNFTFVPFSESAGFAPSQMVYSTGGRLHSTTPPAIAVSDDGTVHMAYAEGPFTQAAVNLTYLTFDALGGWSAPAVWRLASLPDPLVLKASGDGHVAMSWTLWGATEEAIMVQRYVPGSGWRQAERVDEPLSASHRLGFHVQAVSDGGNVTVLWHDIETYAWLLAVRTFVAGNDPPVVTITSPLQDATLAEPSVVVSGTVQPVSRVSINGVAAAVANDGSFSARIAVAPGVNTVEVSAVDEWGNTGSAGLTVTFDDPAAAALAEAQAQLALNSDELNQTTDELGRVKVQFAWLQSNASAAEANATVIKGELTALQSDYDAAQGRIILLESQQNTSMNVVRETADTNAALAGQVATLSILAMAALLGAVGALAVMMVQLKRGSGGGGGGGGGSGGGSEPRAAGQVSQGAEPAKGGPHDKGEPQGPANHGA